MDRLIFLWLQAGATTQSHIKKVSHKYTYVVDALLGQSSGGWGGAGPAGWLNSMQHGFGSKKGQQVIPRRLNLNSFVSKVFKGSAHLRYGCHEIARGWCRLIRVEDWVGHSANGGHPLHVLIG